MEKKFPFHKRCCRFFTSQSLNFEITFFFKLLLVILEKFFRTHLKIRAYFQQFKGWNDRVKPHDKERR